MMGTLVPGNGVVVRLFFVVGPRSAAGGGRPEERRARFAR
jgi:hypothetical protein